ncbi:MAG TPA: hypothetical protein VFB22_05160 [Candidatus Baltobacteraceae bacterium]|nr:hypothetical protein [Candidatus Baltobacteraceae bacterium]
MRKRFDPRAAAALVLLAIAVCAIAAYRLHHDAGAWSPDSAIYLRMTLVDRGMSPTEAKTASDAFMRGTPAAADPQSRDYYGPHPPAFYASQAALFVTRPLYPAIASRLYPRFGPRALKLVSAAAFVLGALVLFASLLPLVPAWYAALGALAFATAPEVLDLSALALTDELATLFWVCTLCAMFAYVRRPAPAALVFVVLACAALDFTRPAAYLPVGAALGALIVVRRDAAARRTASALVVATLIPALAFLLYDAAVHGPSVAAQLRWQYEWERATDPAVAASSPLAWYVRAELTAAALLATAAIYRTAALLPLVLGAFGAVLFRPRVLLGILLGGTVVSLLALVVNPTEYARTVELPVTPVVAILAAYALAELGRVVVATRAQRNGTNPSRATVVR